jgi:cell division transport system permease protein
LKKNRSKKKRLGNSKIGIIALSISLALSIVGVLGTLLLHANSLINKVKNNVELHVYIESNLNENSRTKLMQELESYPFINKSVQNPVVYKSMEDMANQMIQKNIIPKDYAQILGYNPIKPCFILKIAPEFSTSSKLERIASQLKESTGIFEVDLSSERNNDLTIVVKNLSIIAMILGIFTLISILSISILINNTIKLSLFSQRFLIRSMQLVGAKQSFIKKPFLINTALQGFIGGLIAAGISYLAVRFAHGYLADLGDLFLFRDSIILYASLVVFGVIISLFSAWISLNKYLKLSLDELY